MNQRMKKMTEPTDSERRQTMLSFWRFCFGWAPDPDWEWLEAMEAQVKEKADTIQKEEEDGNQ